MIISSTFYENPAVNASVYAHSYGIMKEEYSMYQFIYSQEHQ